MPQPVIEDTVAEPDLIGPIGGHPLIEYLERDGIAHAEAFELARGAEARQDGVVQLRLIVGVELPPNGSALEGIEGKTMCPHVVSKIEEIGELRPTAPLFAENADRRDRAPLNQPETIDGVSAGRRGLGFAQWRVTGLAIEPSPIEFSGIGTQHAHARPCGAEQDRTAPSGTMQLQDPPKSVVQLVDDRAVEDVSS